MHPDHDGPPLPGRRGRRGIDVEREAVFLPEQRTGPAASHLGVEAEVLQAGRSEFGRGPRRRPRRHGLRRAPAEFSHRGRRIGDAEKGLPVGRNGPNDRTGERFDLFRDGRVGMDDVVDLARMKVAAGDQQQNGRQNGDTRKRAPRHPAER